MWGATRRSVVASRCCVDEGIASAGVSPSSRPMLLHTNFWKRAFGAKSR